MRWPTISKEFQEQLEVLRYLARDKKYRGVWTHKAFIETRKDFDRIIKMKGLGRELRPGSYKKIAVSHHNYGTDAWEIRLSASRSHVVLNKDNWESFTYWVRSLEHYAPSSAVTLMEKYPNVRIKTWGEE